MKSESDIGNKTALVYCRAANNQDAQRQLEAARDKAKQLNAAVEAVFVDIIPARKQIVWSILRLFKPCKPMKAAKRTQWRIAMNCLKKHKFDYVIAENPGRLSRDEEEYQEITKGIKGCGANVVFF